MISEKFPELANLDPHDKAILAGELWKSATTTDSDGAVLTPEAARAIQQRLEHYFENPETGLTWEEVKAKAAENRARD